MYHKLIVYSYQHSGNTNHQHLKFLGILSDKLNEIYTDRLCISSMHSTHVCFAPLHSRFQEFRTRIKRRARRERIRDLITLFCARLALLTHFIEWTASYNIYL
jgi:hypothetical protein